MPKKGQPVAKKPSPTDGLVEEVKGDYRGKAWKKSLAKELRDLLIAHDAVFSHMGTKDLAEKYGLSRRGIEKVRSQEKIRAVEALWEQQMFDAHRAMGVEALNATLELIRQRDPYTVNQYWKRMGVQREPVVGIEVKELKLEIPPHIQNLVQGVLRDIPKPQLLEAIDAEDTTESSD